MADPNIDEIYNEMRLLKRKLKTSRYLHLESEKEKTSKDIIIKELYKLNQNLKREQDTLGKVMHLLMQTTTAPVHICPLCGSVQSSNAPEIILCSSCYGALEEKPIIKIKIPEKYCDKLDSSEVENVKK